MTAAESPVTVTTSTEATTARCECGHASVIEHRTRTHRFEGRTAAALEAWAEHWHQRHESETT